MLKPHFLVLHMLMTNVFQPGRKNDHHSTYIALFGSRVAGTFSRPYSSERNFKLNFTSQL